MICVKFKLQPKMYIVKGRYHFESGVIIEEISYLAGFYFTGQDYSYTMSANRQEAILMTKEEAYDVRNNSPQLCHYRVYRLKKEDKLPRQRKSGGLKQQERNFLAGKF